MFDKRLYTNPLLPGEEDPEAVTDEAESTGTKAIEISEEGENDQSSTKVNKKKRWNKFFSELEKFKSEHGHVNVDVNSDLGKWCAKQVSHYSKYKRSSDNTLSDEQAKQLSDIGLDLMTVAEKKFFSNIEDMKKYKEEHGHCRFPRGSRLYQVLKTQKEVVSSVGTAC
jgi:hypothetical protein